MAERKTNLPCPDCKELLILSPAEKATSDYPSVPGFLYCQHCDWNSTKNPEELETVKSL